MRVSVYNEQIVRPACLLVPVASKVTIHYSQSIKNSWENLKGNHHHYCKNSKTKTSRKSTQDTVSLHDVQSKLFTADVNLVWFRKLYLYEEQHTETIKIFRYNVCCFALFCFVFPRFTTRPATNHKLFQAFLFLWQTRWDQKYRNGLALTETSSKYCTHFFTRLACLYFCPKKFLLPSENRETFRYPQGPVGTEWCFRADYGLSKFQVHRM